MDSDGSKGKVRVSDTYAKVCYEEVMASYEFKKVTGVEDFALAWILECSQWSSERECL